MAFDKRAYNRRYYQIHKDEWASKYGNGPIGTKRYSMGDAAARKGLNMATYQNSSDEDRRNATIKKLMANSTKGGMAGAVAREALKTAGKYGNINRIGNASKKAKKIVSNLMKKYASNRSSKK